MPSDEGLEAYDNYADYFEAVVLFCEMPGCRWRADVGWSDLSGDPSEARLLFAAHWDEAHSSTREARGGAGADDDTHRGVGQ